ncbi:MAG: YoaK family protein [Eubacterium sp.]|nr:YoaK family protein [Eubacterium sp.]
MYTTVTPSPVIRNDRLDVALHLIMAHLGGFMGSYAIVLHAGTFGSAVTGDMIALAHVLVGRDWIESLHRVIAFFLFALGCATSHLMNKYTNLPMRKVTLAVEAVLLAVAAAIPFRGDPEPPLFPIFFCASFQWGTFSGALGYGSSTIFCSNNTKQAVTAWCDFWTEHDTKKKVKALLYTFTLLFFFAGALVGALIIPRSGSIAALFGWIPLAAALIAQLIAERFTKA